MSLFYYSDAEHLIKRTFPVVSDSDIMDNNTEPMPFYYLTAYIDLENISSIKIAMNSGFIPYDLTVDPTKKEGEGYQIEFRFSKSEIAINSIMLKAILENVRHLPDPIIKNALIQQCKIRVKQREIEDTQFAKYLNGSLKTMGPKKLIKELQKDIRLNKK